MPSSQYFSRGDRTLNKQIIISLQVWEVLQMSITRGILVTISWVAGEGIPEEAMFKLESEG